jgi:hypothetical protein
MGNELYRSNLAVEVIGKILFPGSRPAHRRRKTLRLLFIVTAALVGIALLLLVLWLLNRPL